MGYNFFLLINLACLSFLAAILIEMNIVYIQRGRSLLLYSICLAVDHEPLNAKVHVITFYDSCRLIQII